ncbi:helix-turn-helix domain-containing protein [Paenibacillus ginsengarvi]|uniref:AraC family transcriptional regulator n=1 Tax=Paenibacillus ginsengarvi TaxID=400777 RepID=A0A3B0BTN3_9BACL|nr:AraC family transcriptional regulator [Paenibacillus ginsengarvi]RKN75811.1 AraC family transcriptional regulator [Paenibacillus ginsengarvi]
MQMSQRQKEHFGTYLANVQTGIRVSSYRTLGAEWIHYNMKYEYNMLYYIVSGRCNIWVNGLHLFPTSGKLLLLPAGSTISATPYNNENFVKYYCHFTSTIGGTRLFDLLHTSAMIEVGDRPFIEKQFRELTDSFTSKGLTSALRAKSTLLQLLCYFVENNPTLSLHDSSHFDIQSINRVLEHIDEHLSDRLTVDDLAGLVHFHPHYFIQVFKSMIGFSPMQFIAKVRYERACTLLASTGLSMHEIAVSVGIEPEYFTKFFKQHSGVSPTGYRDNPVQRDLEHSVLRAGLHRGRSNK